MIIFALILLLVILYKIKFCKNNEFYNDYASPHQTASINAVFTILIFLSHSVQYFNANGPLDKPYMSFRTFLGQLVVATFLFYSGFGIMQSISKKGMDYVKTIPTKRFFKVWYHFAIGLIGFIIINLIFNRDYSLTHTLLSFTGYRSVGNSNWYMFDTFALYFIVFFAFIIARKNKILGVVLTTVFTIGFAFYEYKIGLEELYYNTVFCYVAGMIFSLVKPYFDKFVMKNNKTWVCSFIVCCLLFHCFSENRNVSIVHYNLFSILAVIVIMIFNMKVKITNVILDWISKHIFSIFFLQRIPMLALNELGVSNNEYLFVIISFVLTILIAILFDKAMDKLDSLIYIRKPKKVIEQEK